VEREHDGEAAPARLEHEARREAAQVPDVEQVGGHVIDHTSGRGRRAGVPVGFESVDLAMEVVERDEIDAVSMGSPQVMVGPRGVGGSMQHGHRVRARQAGGEGGGVDLRAARRLRRITVVDQQNPQLTSDAIIRPQCPTLAEHRWRRPFSDRVRILLAVHAFPPRSTAGVEVYTLRLAKALRARGHDVLVLTAVHDLAQAPYSVHRRVYEGVPLAEVVNVHHHGTLERTYDDPQLVRAVLPLLQELRPEVVHIQHLLNLSSGLVSAVRAQGARVLFTVHDYWLTCARDGLRMREDLSVCTIVDHAVCATCLEGSPYLVPVLQRGLARAARGLGAGRYLHRIHDAAPRATEAVLGLLRRRSPPPPALGHDLDRRAAMLRAAMDGIDLLLAPTSFARDRILEMGVPAEKVRLFPYGVLERPAVARPAGARRRFAFIGTLAPHKGAHVLIEAFGGVHTPGITLDIHGSLTVQPSYAARLQAAARADARIRFRGPFPEGMQARIFEDIDVLVVPSVWWENSPITVLEALGAGRAVIASRTGGVPDLLPDGAGLLVPPGDAAALRAALSAVASGQSLGEAREAAMLKTTRDEAEILEALYRADGGSRGTP
jgi:glycosyltransferase involved in cell wall biosynthesis